MKTMEQRFDRVPALEDELQTALAKELAIQEVRYRERINVDNEPIVDVMVYVNKSTDLLNTPFAILDHVIETVQNYFSKIIPGKYTLVSFGKFQ